MNDGEAKSQKQPHDDFCHWWKQYQTNREEGELEPDELISAAIYEATRMRLRTTVSGTERWQFFTLLVAQTAHKAWSDLSSAEKHNLEWEILYNPEYKPPPWAVPYLSSRLE